MKYFFIFFETDVFKTLLVLRILIKSSKFFGVYLILIINVYMFFFCVLVTGYITFREVN